MILEAWPAPLSGAEDRFAARAAAIAEGGARWRVAYDGAEYDLSEADAVTPGPADLKAGTASIDWSWSARLTRGAAEILEDRLTADAVSPEARIEAPRIGVDAAADAWLKRQYLEGDFADEWLGEKGRKRQFREHRAYFQGWFVVALAATDLDLPPFPGAAGDPTPLEAFVFHDPPVRDGVWASAALWGPDDARRIARGVDPDAPRGERFAPDRGAVSAAQWLWFWAERGHWIRLRALPLDAEGFPAEPVAFSARSFVV